MNRKLSRGLWLASAFCAAVIGTATAQQDKPAATPAQETASSVKPIEPEKATIGKPFKDFTLRDIASEKKEKVSQIEATLFKLQDEWFLDFLGEMPEDSKFPPPIPSHMLFKIVQRSPELKFVFMNIEWLQKHLEKEPKALRHHMLKSGDKPEDKLPVLTAETEELQRFVVKHIKTADAWSEVITLKRAGK